MTERTETLPGDPPCVVRHQYAVLNGVRLHYVEAATTPARAPLICFLHGFPEFWYSWRHQLSALAAAGYRVLAPDLRGYNESDKPRGLPSYQIDVLTADVAELIRHAGETAAVVVGHDWGGGIAWLLAMTRPEVVSRLVILNAPHPAAFLRDLRRADQLWRSSYMLFFQLPELPEWFLQAGNYAFLERALRRQPVHANAFTPTDIRLYKRALAQPGALSAALNYYRAAFRYRRQLPSHLRPIQAPTLLIWGEQDPYLGVHLTEGLESWVPNLRVERLPDSSHWVQNDTPEEVNRLLLDFVGPSWG